MTDRAGLAPWHPRLVAGLWFGTFIALVHLTFGLAHTLIFHFLGYRRPLVYTLAEGYPLLAAACLGAWLGSALLTRPASAAEGARRGAWIGILSGIAAAMVTTFLTFASVASPSGGFGWPTAGWTVVLVLFRGGAMLPIGALAGWCLVKMKRSPRRSEDGRKAP